MDISKKLSVGGGIVLIIIFLLVILLALPMGLLFGLDLIGMDIQYNFKTISGAFILIIIALMIKSLKAPKQ